MTDGKARFPTARAEAAAVLADGPTAGQLLRAAREAQGLHVAALAAAIKVAPRKLDALENDRSDELPDATFARALAQTVCRTLKIDPVPVLARLPRLAALPGSSSAGLNQPFPGRPGRVDAASGLGSVKPLMWAAAVLMAAALVVYALPEAWWTAPPGRGELLSAWRRSLAPTPAPDPAAGADGAAPAPTPAPAPMIVDAALPSALLPSALLPTASAGGSTGGSASGSTGGSAGVSTGAAAAAGTELPAPGAEVQPLQITASAASWVEVRDGAGRVLLSRHFSAGESRGVDGAAPLQLVVGNAPATRVTYRGVDVDLLGVAQAKVARVELK